MTDNNDFEPRLAGAMRRYARRAPTDVDALALAREIATASSKEADRRPRWWPFGRSNQEQGRSRTMFIASGATAVAAVAVLGASLASTGLVSGPDQDPVPPGAEAPTVGEEWAFFTGKLTFDGQPAGRSEYTVENGMLRDEGGGWSGQTMVDDPRMTGKRTEIIKGWSGNNQSNEIWTSLVTIDTSEGAWSCSTPGVSIGDSLGSESGWCDGEGAHDGLRAFVIFDFHDGGPRTTEDFFGYITSGDGPAPGRGAHRIALDPTVPPSRVMLSGLLAVER